MPSNRHNKPSKTVLKINKISESRELYLIVIKKNGSELSHTKHLIVGWELEDEYEPTPLVIPDFNDQNIVSEFININNTFISKDDKCVHLNSIEEVIKYCVVNY